jgi:hypothetical protein
MMFVCPGRPMNYIRQGDFHFYKQHGVVEYKIKPGTPSKSVAKFFKVPESRVKRVVSLRLVNVSFSKPMYSVTSVVGLLVRF